MSAVLKSGPTNVDLVKGYRYIVIRDGYMGGKPALLERRIAVNQILEALSQGMTFQEIWNAYSVPLESVQEILRYAAEITSTRQCG